MFAAIIEGKDADLCFLVAVILFTVAAVLELVGRAVPVLVTAGLAFVALGWLIV